MKAVVEKIDNYKLTLKIEIPKSEVIKAMDKAYIKLASKINVPGFRKGKVPRNILELRIGKETLLEEVFEILASPAYFEALEQKKLEPVAKPKIDIIILNENEPLIFKAEVIIKPEVKLGKYKGLIVKKAKYLVSEEDLEKSLKVLREQHSKMVVVENAIIQNGDFVIVDFKGFINGKPFKGSDAKGFSLIIGEGVLIANFEENLIGLKTGEKKEISIKFPNDYSLKEIAGKEALFKVTIVDIKRREIPECNDEFAKEINGFNSIEDLKDDLRKKLEENANKKEEIKFKNEVIKKAVTNTEIDVPKVMIDQKVENMLDELKQSLKKQGSNIEKFLSYAKIDIADLHKEQYKTALNQIKTNLMLETIAKIEGFNVSENEINIEIVKIAKTYQKSPAEMKEIIFRSDKQKTLINTIMRKKAADLIVENAIQG